MVTASGHPKGDAPIKTIQEIHKVIFGQFLYLSWQFRRLPQTTRIWPGDHYDFTTNISLQFNERIALINLEQQNELEST